MTNFYLLVLFILATYRLTRIVVFDTIGRIIRAPFIEEKYVEEDGEIQKYTRLRFETGLGKWIGTLLSLYMLFYFFPVFGVAVLCIFAVAGGAALLETINLKIM